MTYLFTILEKIKNRYGVYIGHRSLYKLADFIAGFECAVYELTSANIDFNSKFQIFIENRTKTICTGKHWSDIISESISQETAFDLFFVYLDDFKKLVNNSNVFSDMYEENMRNVKSWFNNEN